MDDTQREAARQRAERHIEMLRGCEPQGMVSKLHICCWSDALSHSTRDVLALTSEPAPAATDTPTHDCADHAITANEGTSHCAECERQARTGDARDGLIREDVTYTDSDQSTIRRVAELNDMLAASEEHTQYWQGKADRLERELADARAALKAIIEEPGLTGKTGSYPARIRVIARAALSRVAETGGQA